MDWIKRENEKHTPTISGWYRVVIEGDSESDGPHVYYDYSDYHAWMYITVDYDEQDATVTGNGEHDEELDQVIAWFGPIHIPPIFQKIKLTTN